MDLRAEFGAPGGDQRAAFVSLTLHPKEMKKELMNADCA